MGQILVKTPQAIIIGVVTKDNVEEVLSELKSLGDEQGMLSACDALEFRADTFPKGNAISFLMELRKGLIRKSKNGVSLLYTNRLEMDGGNWRKSPGERYPALSDAMNRGLVDWVDLEIEQISHAPNSLLDEISNSPVQLMVSHHNFKHSYDEKGYGELTDAMAEWRPDMIKFAVKVLTKEYLEILFEYARKLGRRYPASCLIAMGKFGRISRIGSPLMGVPLTYGYIGDRPVVDGQLQVQVLRNQFTRMVEKTAGDLSGGQLVELLEEEQDVGV